MCFFRNYGKVVEQQLLDTQPNSSDVNNFTQQDNDKHVEQQPTEEKETTYNRPQVDGFMPQFGKGFRMQTENLPCAGTGSISEKKYNNGLTSTPFGGAVESKKKKGKQSHRKNNEEGEYHDLQIKSRHRRAGHPRNTVKRMELHGSVESIQSRAT